jgi:hypothetical protein
MSHLTEEDLVLHHYGESVGAEAASVLAHLAACEPCRAAMAALQADLAAVTADPVPEPGAGFPGRVWDRLRPRLEARPQVRGSFAVRPPRRFAPRRLAYGAALAASLVFAFVLGRHWPPSGGDRPIPEPVRERILLVAVGDHLERSQMILVELMNADGEGSLDVSAQQQSAEELVEASRLYRQAALRSGGDAGVTSVLEELERVLVDVANGPSRLSASELRDVRRRIEDGGLLFRVRVLGSQMRDRGKEAVKGNGGIVS